VTEHQDGNKIEYEKTDADLAAVTRVGAGLAVLTIVVSLALVPILKGMIGRQAKGDAAPPPIAGFEPGRQAPEPRLQGEPYGDWTSLKARQESLLDSYGWVDESKGVTRIRIDQAMKLLIERGVPVRTAASPAAPASPVPSPTAAGGHP
jgi:hypothetical protein